MLSALLSLIFDPFLHSGSDSDSTGEGGGSYNYDEMNSGSYSGRWTMNEINIQHNIDAGMGIKDEE